MGLGRSVVAPDHPYLMRGPDVLASDGSGLLAIFVERAVEVKRHAELQARYILSKLALPSDTRFVLVHRGGELHARDWDLVLDEDFDRRAAQRVPGIRRTTDQTPPGTRQLARNREPIVDGIRSSSLNPQREVDYRRLTRRRSVVRVSDVGLESDATGLAAAASIARLNLLTSLTVPAEFMVDNGAVYPAADHFPVHVMHASEGIVLSQQVFDPYKVVRAAAFAGWAIEGIAPERAIWDESFERGWDAEDG